LAVKKKKSAPANEEKKSAPAKRGRPYQMIDFIEVHHDASIMNKISALN
jgi:hypothetical protein